MISDASPAAQHDMPAGARAPSNPTIKEELVLASSRAFQHLSRMALGFGGNLHTAEHARQFLKVFVVRKLFCRGDRASFCRAFDHCVGMVGESRDLWKMRNAQHLSLACKRF